MKTKIIPVNRGSHYAQEERIVSADFTEDNNPVRIVARGFVPYLLWEFEQRPALKALMSLRNDEATPTEEEQNRTYFEDMFEKYDIPEGLPYAPTNEEKREIFRPIHVMTEREQFEALPADLKKTYGRRFEKYMLWLNQGKEYDSIVRVRAFKMMLEQESEKIDFHKQNDIALWNKGAIYGYVKSRWPDQSQLTLYKQFIDFMVKPEYYKKTHSKDFAFACAMVLTNKNP